MRFQRHLLRLISVIYFICFARAKKLCDVRVWYLNMISDDVFNVNLSDEQLNLKNSIESMVLKASESRETRMMDCSVLYMYNDMLKESFNYTPSKSGMSLKEVETQEPLHSNDNAKNDDEEVGITSDTDDKKEVQVKQTTGETSENNIAAKDTKTGTEETVEIYDNGDPYDTQNSMANTEQTATEDEIDNTETFQTDEIDHIAVEGTSENLYMNTDNIDETELLEDDNHDLSMTKDNSEGSKQTNQRNIEETQHDKENDSALSANEEELFVTSSIPFGVCWSFGCLMSDVFDVYGRGLDDFSNELNDKTKTILKSRKKLSSKRKVKIKRPKGPFCTLNQFYKYLVSKSFCMKDFVTSSSKSTEKMDEITQSSNNDIYHEQKSTGANLGHFGIPNEKSVDTNSKIEEPIQNVHETNSYSTINYLTNGQEEMKLFTDAKAQTYRNADDREKHSYFTETKEESKLSIREFENIVEQKTSKYYSKIQSIEVMIMRLENQLLLEALNKQNHTSTITKLENQILKLENELLKMNKNYQNLREESESISRRQNRYLELAYKQTRKEYPKLPDRSKEKYELITQHQTKINELAEVLRNQSSIIMELKGKYDTLEEQNRMLHQMVMNQTIFMSSIVKTVQDLTEQNVRNREEIKTLKHKVEKNYASAEHVKSGEYKNKPDVIDELDTLLFDNMLQKGRTADNTEEDSEISGNSKHEEQDADSHLKDYVGNISYSNVITNWCPRDNMTCPACRPVLYSGCIPFRNVVWSTCKVRNLEEQKQADSDYPTIPDVKDESKENEIYDKRQDAQNIQIQELPTTLSETDQETVDANLHVIQNDNGQKSEENSEDGEISLNNDKVMHAEEDKEFSRYIIVGYDKDSRPVFKIREDIADKEIYVEIATEEDRKNLKTDTKTSGINLHVTDKEQLTFNEDTDKIEQYTGTENKVDDLRKGDEKEEHKRSEDMETQIPILKDQDIKTEDSDEKQEEHISEEARGTDSHPDQTSQEKDINSAKNDNTLNTASDKENSIDKDANNKDSATNDTPVSDQNKDSKTRKDSLSDQADNLRGKHTAQENMEEEGSKEVFKEDKGSVTHDSAAFDNMKKIHDGQGSIVNQGDNLSSKDTVHENIKEDSNSILNTGKDSVSDKQNLDSNQDQQNIKTVNKAEKENKLQKQKPKATNVENKPRERKIPINLNKNKQNEPKDCYDYYARGERKDGLFKVKPLGSDRLMEVFCDMRRGGWTVIQRRQDGTTNFFKEWDDYKKGFGGLYGEHWLGNDNIHLLTNQDYYKLRVDLMDWDKTKKYAEFDYFLVDNEDEGFKLYIDGYTGDAGDGLTKHDGSKFSTKDVDNDKVIKEFGGSCAKRFYGAGWYYKCYSSNLNGKFYKGGKIPEKRFDGVTWKPWTGPNYSLKKVEMKIRPASAKK